MERMYFWSCILNWVMILALIILRLEQYQLIAAGDPSLSFADLKFKLKQQRQGANGFPIFYPPPPPPSSLSNFDSKVKHLDLSLSAIIQTDLSAEVYAGGEIFPT